ncbi:hypothetical protein Tco_0004776 [Tanacetum coccineum]
MILKVARLSNSLRDLPLAYSDDEAYFNHRNRSVYDFEVARKIVYRWDQELMNTYDMDEFCEYNALDLGWGLCPSIEVRQAYRQFVGAVVELIDGVVNDEEFKEAALAVYRLFGVPGEEEEVNIRIIEKK